MARVKTFTDSGSLQAVDLNNIQDAYEPAFASYHNLFERNVIGAGATGPLLMSARSFTQSLGNYYASDSVFYLDPADLQLGARAAKVRVVGTIVCQNGGVAGPGNVVINLYPVTSWVAVANSGAAAATIGAPLASASFAAPFTAQADVTVAGADATLAAAGWYVLGSDGSGLTGSASGLQVRAVVQARRV